MNIPMHRERYIRLDITHPCGWNVVPGMEWRATDDIGELRRSLTNLILAASPTDIATLAQSIADAFDRLWPGRAWFLEIEDSPGSWVQVYQPWTGIPNVTWDGYGRVVTHYAEVRCAP